MLKNKIYKYFFVEFFKIFLLISLSLSILIWMTQAARLLELVTEYGNPISIYLKYIVLRYPKILEDTFLLSFLISIFFLFSKFENSKEIYIYWLSGINKLTIFNLCIFISIIVLVVNLSLSIIIAPSSLYKGRLVLSQSKFSLINSLVKENNFNSPLKGLTIYVQKNDNQGNLENIFIYENNRTIIAEKGRVLLNSDGYVLELIKGITQEKLGNNINTISFESTIFNISKFELRNTTYPKLTERNINWIYKNLNNSKEIYNKEVRQEFSRRVIKPFIILIIVSLSCFLLYSNNERISTKKKKIFTYALSFFILILNQVIINFTGNHKYSWLIYFLFIILTFIIISFTIKKILNPEINSK